jgi:glyoxylase-like metal-dependent hydrolase (beta-lactamase superfamily II)
MRLLERVYLVGSGNLGFDLTDPYDCHIYAVDGGDEVALVDAGSGMATDAVLDHVVRDGLDPKRIRHLVLTHGHADHVGGAAAMRRLLDGPAVYISSAVADALRQADASALSVDVAKSAGRYPRDYPLEACGVDVELHEGAAISVGELQLEVLLTPGHSSGDVCLLLSQNGQRVLFSGDLIFYGGAVLLQNMWDARLEDLIRSLRRLRAVGANALLPGHLMITLSDGQRHIERANQMLDALRIPDQLPIPW